MEAALVPLGLGVGELLLIGVALLLLFGARKIPLIARGIGEGIRNFKGEVAGKGEIAGRSPAEEQERPGLEDGEDVDR